MIHVVSTDYEMDNHQKSRHQCGRDLGQAASKLYGTVTEKPYTRLLKLFILSAYLLKPITQFRKSGMIFFILNLTSKIGFSKSKTAKL